jgi:hypothetical protein
MPNNGMHPTADTSDFIFDIVAGRRVMPGVRCLPILSLLLVWLN